MGLGRLVGKPSAPRRETGRFLHLVAMPRMDPQGGVRVTAVVHVRRLVTELGEDAAAATQVRWAEPKECT